MIYLDDALNESVLTELKYSVEANFKTEFPIDTIKAKIMKEMNVPETLQLRRAYDGVTEIGWLIEKMIGELLIEGKINL